MGFTRKIEYYLVHSLKYSNKQARLLIKTNKVIINGNIINENCIISESDEIIVNNTIAKQKKHFVYIKYYKPVGFVSSLNKHVKDSLFEQFKTQLPLCIAGRLDKNSEGLLLLTNDGKWAKNITDPNNYKEKKYVVSVNLKLTQAFIHSLENGLAIKNYITRPCTCAVINDYAFEITLTEGKNRQIRRMCSAMGYKVVSLKRIKIDNIHLGNLLENKQELLIF